MTDDDSDRTISGTAAGLAALLQTAPPRSALRARRPEITLHQLRIFWAVAHSETLTRAAKQLGLAPALAVAAAIEARDHGRHPPVPPPLQ